MPSDSVKNALGGRRPAKTTATAQVDDVGLKVSGKSVFARSSIVLDPADAGITQAIKRLEQKVVFKGFCHSRGPMPAQGPKQGCEARVPASPRSV